MRANRQTHLPVSPAYSRKRVVDNPSSRDQRWYGVAPVVLHQYDHGPESLQQKWGLVCQCSSGAREGGSCPDHQRPINGGIGIIKRKYQPIQ